MTTGYTGKPGLLASHYLLPSNPQKESSITATSILYTATPAQSIKA
jgi:hypothetical protein